MNSIAPKGVGQLLLRAGVVASIVAGAAGTALVALTRDSVLISQTFITTGATQTFGPYNRDIAITIDAMGDTVTWTTTDVPTAVASAASVTAVQVASAPWAGSAALLASLPDPSTLAGGTLGYAADTGLVYSNGTVWKTVTAT